MIYRDALLGLPSATLQKDMPSGVNISYVGLGREAIFQGLGSLGIGEGQSVLVPAYICKTAVEPFCRKKIRIKYYKIKRDFTPDLESLKEAREAQTKALLYVNYFGLADHFDIYQKFCQENGLYLIEDNAHTLLPDYRLARGDISIFSLRKFYPVPNGALLLLKNAKIASGSIPTGVDRQRTFCAADYKFMLGASARRAYRYFSNRLTNTALLKLQKRREKNAAGQEGPADPFLSQKLLKISFDVFRRLSSGEITQKRRDNYGFLLTRVMEIAGGYFTVPFQSLPDHYSPLAFPVIVRKHRQDFIENLFLNGYVCYTWPDMPGEITQNNDFKDEHFLNNTIALLPIHQDMTGRHLERMVHAIKKWVAKIDRGN